MRSTERGMSLSPMLAVLTLALLVLMGLVIDGGAQLTAERRAERVAAAAARAGADEAATARLGGHEPDIAAVVAKARGVLASSPDVAGEVTLAAGRVRVRTAASTDTILLSLIGVNRLEASGYAEADLRADR